MSGVFISLYLSQAVFLELSPSVCLSVFVCLSRLTTARLVSVYLKDCLSVCLSLSLTILSTCLHKSFSVAISICQPLLLPFLVTMSMPIYLLYAYYTVYLVICWAVSFSVCLSVYLIVNKSQFSAFVKLRAMRRLRESNPWIIGLIATICNENFIPEDHQAATSN